MQGLWLLIGIFGRTTQGKLAMPAVAICRCGEHYCQGKLTDANGVGSLLPQLSALLLLHLSANQKFTIVASNFHRTLYPVCHQAHQHQELLIENEHGG